MDMADGVVIRCVIELDSLGGQVMVSRCAAASVEDVRDLCELVAAGDPVIRWCVQD